MNCKPGDLAIYVGHADNLRGFIFRVIRAASGWYCAWEVDPPPPPGAGYLAIGIVMDESLRLIRDPGDDAVDEMVVIAGKPEHQPA